MDKVIRSRAAFIDRDGVINEDRNYVYKVQDFFLVPGAVFGLRMLQDAGFRLVVVTNQAGIGRGYYTEEDYLRITSHMIAVLAKNGINFAGVYHCPHHPSVAVDAYDQICDCRKPMPGMLFSAARDMNIDLGRSVMVGDKLSDIEAGRSAGVLNCILVGTGHAVKVEDRVLADAYCNDLPDAARWILANS